MHPNSMKLMRYFRSNYLDNKMHGCSVLDVGAKCAKDTHQSYREIFGGYEYIGMDIESGRNVDIVGFESIKKKFDVIISGQVMEHVNRPWDWLASLTAYFTKYICIIAPNTHPEHKHPIDTYRYFPDGMRDLFDYAKIKELEILKRGDDTIGIGTHENR